MITEVSAEVIDCNEASDATEAESSDSDVESIQDGFSDKGLST